MTTKTYNVPGRVISFYEGGQAHQTYTNALRKGEVPVADEHDLGADELELFRAVDAGRIVKPSKGGFYVRAELTPVAQEALRYWAETLYSSSGDNARDGDQDARNDVRAAERALKMLG